MIVHLVPQVAQQIKFDSARDTAVCTYSNFLADKQREELTWGWLVVCDDAEEVRNSEHVQPAGAEWRRPTCPVTIAVCVCKLLCLSDPHQLVQTDHNSQKASLKGHLGQGRTTIYVVCYKHTTHLCFEDNPNELQWPWILGHPSPSADVQSH